MVDQEDLNKSVQDIEDVSDEEQVQAQIESAERELQTFKDALEQKQKEKENYAIQVENIEKIRQKQIAGYVKIEPQYEFEKDPEYWELMTNELKYKHRHERQTEEGTLKRFDAEFESIQERIDTNEAKIEKLKSILEE